MNKDSDARHSIADSSTPVGTGVTPEDIVPLLADWDEAEVQKLVALLQEKLEGGSGGNGGDGSTSNAANSSKGWVEVKKVNGCGPYAYERYRDGNGRKRYGRYLGKARLAGGVA